MFLLNNKYLIIPYKVGLIDIRMVISKVGAL